jgi:hypothetical protein
MILDQQPIVLIDNTNFDVSGYDLFPTIPITGKRERSPSPDDDYDDKKARIGLNVFIQAFSTLYLQPRQLSIAAIPLALSDYRRLYDYPFRAEFTQAMHVEFSKLI